MIGQTVYIVWGLCGEYEDRKDWVASIHASIDSAEAFAKKLNDAYQASVLWHGGGTREEQNAAESLMRSLDPSFAHYFDTDPDVRTHYQISCPFEIRP